MARDKPSKLKLLNFMRPIMNLLPEVDQPDNKVILSSNPLI